MAREPSYEELKKRVRELEKELTKKDRTEEQLLEANRRFATLVEAIPDAIFFKDDEGRHVLVNKACEELIGLPKETIIGKTDGQLLPPDLAEHCRRSDQETMKRVKPTRFEEEMTMNAGERVFFETMKVSLLDDKGNVTGLVG